MGSYQKYFFRLIFVLVVILSMWFVMATLTGVTLVTPAANANISGTYTFNATITGTSAENVTFYWWNSSGSSWVSLCTNDTAGGGPFSCSYDTSNIPDGTSYVFNATALNGTASATQTDNNTGITSDNTAPNVSAINTPVSNGNYSGTLTLNASVNDSTIGMDTVYFNISNSSGEATTVSTTQAGLYWSGSLTLSTLADGTYNVTVYANDSLNNLNSSVYVSITIDNTAPSVTASCSPSTVTSGASFPCSCSRSDATSGVNTTSGSSTSGTILNTGDTGTFTYTCTVVDSAGNSRSASATYTVEQNPGSPKTTTTTTTWTTHTITDSVFEQGYTREMGVRSRIKVRVDNEDHFVGVISISETLATIEISSDPVQVSLAVGEDAKVDVTDDGFYDVYVLLNGIANNKADVTIQKIHEEVPEGGTGIETTGEVEGEQPPVEEKEGISVLVWILVAVVIIAVIVWQMKTKKK